MQTFSQRLGKQFLICEHDQRTEHPIYALVSEFLHTLAHELCGPESMDNPFIWPYPQPRIFPHELSSVQKKLKPVTPDFSLVLTDMKTFIRLMLLLFEIKRLTVEKETKKAKGTEKQPDETETTVHHREGPQDATAQPPASGGKLIWDDNHILDTLAFEKFLEAFIQSLAQSTYAFASNENQKFIHASTIIGFYITGYKLTRPDNLDPVLQEHGIHSINFDEATQEYASSAPITENVLRELYPPDERSQMIKFIAINQPVCAFNRATSTAVPTQAFLCFLRKAMEEQGVNVSQTQSLELANASHTETPASQEMADKALKKWYRRTDPLVQPKAPSTPPRRENNYKESPMSPTPTWKEVDLPGGVLLEPASPSEKNRRSTKKKESPGSKAWKPLNRSGGFVVPRDDDSFRPHTRKRRRKDSERQDVASHASTSQALDTARSSSSPDLTLERGGIFDDITQS